MSSPNQLAIATEGQNPLAAASGALQGFIGRASSAIKNGYEAAREIPHNLKTYAAIGTSAVTLFTLANAETATGDTSPITPEGNVPGLIGATLLSGNPEASASTATPPPDATSQQECITDALAPVDIRNAQLGPVPGAPQSAFINFVDTSMPDNCASQFNVVRDERVQFVVQNPTRRAVWIPFAGVKFKYNDLGIIGNDGGFHTEPIYSVGKNTYGLYRCTPGPKKTGAKAEVEEIPENAQTEQPLVKPKVFVSPIKHISPKAC